jgi:hypothetical protein
MQRVPPVTPLTDSELDAIEKAARDSMAFNYQDTPQRWILNELREANRTMLALVAELRERRRNAG